MAHTFQRLKEIIRSLDQTPAYERLLGHAIVLGRSYKSPLREEKHASFNVYQSKGGALLWKDFAGQQGDLYDLISAAHGVTFVEAVKVAGGLLNVQEHDVPVKLPRMIKLAQRTAQQSIVKTVNRAWEGPDMALWYRWGIDKLRAMQYGLEPLERAWIERKGAQTLEYFHDPKDPLYGFHINDHTKLYRPLAANKKERYIGNTTRDDIFGLHQLPIEKVRDIVIIGGQKDCLAMRCNTPLWSVAFNSENMTPSELQMQELYSRCETLWVMLDNDKTGIESMHRLKAAYPFVELLFSMTFSKRKDLCEMLENGEMYAVNNIAGHIILGST